MVKVRIFVVNECCGVVFGFWWGDRGSENEISPRDTRELARGEYPNNFSFSNYISNEY